MLKANNINISNTSLTGQNVNDGFAYIKFDLNWENSWRIAEGPSNWDAAWVFVKFRVSNGIWQHAKLNNNGHIVPSEMMIQPGLVDESNTFDNTSNPATGVFIFRESNGSGPVNLSGIKIRWNYAANSVSDHAVVDIKVFALEMVYVPQSSFYLGSGGIEEGSFTNGSWVLGESPHPFLIENEEQLQIAHESGKLWGTSASVNSNVGSPGILSENYPKGFSSFYSMKYEITQQQYVDFLNTLPATIAQTRITTTSSYRQSITRTNDVYITARPNLANNFMSWADGTAYADWAGLRPMTELEYEKACRGPLEPIPNEFAWGNETITTAKYTLSNANSSTEMIATNYNLTSGNSNYKSSVPSAFNGPLRVGIFALSNSIRVQAGASFYGIMELSGNLWERTITIGNAEGRAFTGIHGDGEVPEGICNVSSWPSQSSALGSGFRGGSFGQDAINSTISDRMNAVYTETNRSSSFGFRAIRTSPF